jgi:putative transposase
MPQDEARRTARHEATPAYARAVIRKLAEGDKLLAEGKTVEEVSRHLEITDATWHRWQAQYGGMKADDAKRLKELEREILSTPGVPLRVRLVPSSQAAVAQIQGLIRCEVAHATGRLATQGARSSRRHGIYSSTPSTRHVPWQEAILAV